MSEKFRHAKIFSAGCREDFKGEQMRASKGGQFLNITGAPIRCVMASP
jgi:hypothetical protein